MNNFYFLWLVIILVSFSIQVICKSVSYYQNDKTIEWDLVEKIHFPCKTNEDEINLKRLNSPLTSNFIREANRNHIEDEISQQQFVFSPTTDTSLIKRIEEISKSRPSSFIHNTNNDNIYPSEIKSEINNMQSSGEEADKIRKNATERIPPPSLMASPSAKSFLRVCEIKYAEYIKKIFPQEDDTAIDANDKEFNGRVLAAPGEYPHMTAIGFRSANGLMDYKCGGSLISENFVITAAHCTNFTGLQPSKVRIGDLNLMVEESYLQPQIHNIKEIFVHPDYKTTSYYNDIAILELENEVELTEFVRPIRLWTQETIPFTTAYAMGYGSTNFARKRTNRLTNLNMTIVPNDECNREMPKFPETEKGILSSQICAKDYAMNRDTCQGDSGGPLQLNIRGRRRNNRFHYHLIGIISYGLYCRSGYPGIYTRISSYLDWIEHIVWRDYFV